MGSCFKSIFNRKKETYYFENPYPAQAGKYHTKDHVRYDIPTNSDVSRDTRIKATKTRDRIEASKTEIEASKIEVRHEPISIEENNIGASKATAEKVEMNSAPKPRDNDVVDFMESYNDINEQVGEVKDERMEDEPEPRSTAQDAEDINENNIQGKREKDRDGVEEEEEGEGVQERVVYHETVQLQVNDAPWREDEDERSQNERSQEDRSQDDRSEEDRSQNDRSQDVGSQGHSSQPSDSTPPSPSPSPSPHHDVTGEEDELTEAIARVVEEAKAISTDNLNGDDADSAGGSKRSSEEITREEFVAVESHSNGDMAFCTEGGNVTVIQTDHYGDQNSSPRSQRSERSERSESAHRSDDDDDVTEAPRAFRDSNHGPEDPRDTQTKQEYGEADGDGGVTVVTVTTTEITRTSASAFGHDEEEEEDDTREPTVALLNKNSAQVLSETKQEQGQPRTTAVMVNGDGEEDELPRELSGLDSPPSPTSLIHINTSFPVDQ